VACEWKYYFNTSKKQGQSYEVNARQQSWLLEKLGTFSKVLNMPAPPRRVNFTKIQNEKLLPVVKQCANDSMLNDAMNVKEIIIIIIIILKTLFLCQFTSS
jgi:hypothetical protein